MFRFATALISLLACATTFAADVTIVVDPKPTTETATRELISIEAFKLIYGATKTDPVVQFAPGSSLDPAVRDRIEALEKEALGQLAAGKNLRPQGPLTLTQVLKAFGKGAPFTSNQKEELLTTLRLQDLGGKIPGTPGEKVKALLMQELKAWILDGKTALKIPANLKAELEKALKAEAAKQKPPKILSADEVETALKDPATALALVAGLAADKFSLIDWMQIAGNVRIAGRTERPGTSTADMREELGKRLAEIGTQNQVGRGSQEPRPSFQAPRPRFSQGQTPCPAPKHPGAGFATPQDFRGNGGSPGNAGFVTLDRPVDDTISLDAGTRNRLQSGRDLGHVSLPFVTHYKDSPSAACQITLVGNPATGPEEVGDGRCAYNAVTARHCVEDDRGALFTDAEIPPFGALSVTRMDSDPTGGDLTMIAFEAECRRDVPMAKLAMASPREGEGILVYAAVPLIGQASTNGGNSTRLMMNVRDPENGGIGIEHGNSGGAVTNELGEIVGVISTKSESIQGIGFFATRDALNFANTFVNPNFAALVTFRRNMARNPASLGDAEHN